MIRSYASKNQQIKSIRGIIICQIPFMAAHFILKFLLAIALINYGHSTKEAYAIATGFAAMSAICMFIWSTFVNRLPDIKYLLKIGVFLSVIAFFILAFLPQWHMFALSIYTTSANMYFICAILFINNHYEAESERQSGNHLYTLSLNSGSVLGVLLGSFLIVEHQQELFIIGSFLMLSGLVSLFIGNRHMLSFPNEIAKKRQHGLFFTLFFVLTAATYFFITYTEILRNIAITLFLLGTVYILYLYKKEKNKNYLIFLAMNWLCSFTYWFDSSIFYTQLSVFLNQSVENISLLGWNISALSIPSINPIIGLLFGLWFTKLYRQKEFSPDNMLSLGLCTIAIAFAFLAIPIYFSSSIKIAFFWPCFAVFAYSLGEFVVSSTLNSQSIGLVNNSKKRGFFLGMNNMSRSTASVCSYFLIMQTAHQQNASQESNFTLYAAATIFTLLATLIFFVISLKNKRTL